MYAPPHIFVGVTDPINPRVETPRRCGIAPSRLRASSRPNSSEPRTIADFPFSATVLPPRAARPLPRSEREWPARSSPRKPSVSDRSSHDSPHRLKGRADAWVGLGRGSDDERNFSPWAFRRGGLIAGPASAGSSPLFSRPSRVREQRLDSMLHEREGRSRYLEGKLSGGRVATTSNVAAAARLPCLCWPRQIARLFEWEALWPF
jgi:hypothetical protein